MQLLTILVAHCLLVYIFFQRSIDFIEMTRKCRNELNEVYFPKVKRYPFDGDSSDDWKPGRRSSVGKKIPTTYNKGKQLIKEKLFQVCFKTKATDKREVFSENIKKAIVDDGENILKPKETITTEKNTETHAYSTKRLLYVH